MSLDVNLMVPRPTSVYSANITHNLNEMAMEVKLNESLTLYDVLWRPGESGMVFARDISDHLDAGWDILLSDPEKFMKFEPDNGGGSYAGLCSFVYNYRNACWDTPDAALSISR